MTTGSRVYMKVEMMIVDDQGYLGSKLQLFKNSMTINMVRCQDQWKDMNCYQELKKTERERVSHNFEDEII